MKTELLADIIQLSHLINDSQDSWFTKASKLQRICSLAAAWNKLQEKVCNVGLTPRDKIHEYKIEQELPKLCYPYPVRFENLHARLIWGEGRELYFPDLNS